MKSCIKGLFDLDNPQEWTLCDNYCLCHNTIDAIDNECVTAEVVTMFCGVRLKKIYLFIYLFIFIKNHTTINLREKEHEIIFFEFWWVSAHSHNIIIWIGVDHVVNRH